MSTTMPGKTQRSFEETAKGRWSWGLVLFAAIMLVAIGLCQFLVGLSAVFEDQILVSAPEYTFALDVTAWGWIHMGIGVLAVATGASLMGGATWARVAGMILAVISALSNFLFLPYYPVWAIVVIAFDIAVIWALSTQLRNT